MFTSTYWSQWITFILHWTREQNFHVNPIYQPSITCSRALWPLTLLFCGLYPFCNDILKDRSGRLKNRTRNIDIYCMQINTEYISFSSVLKAMAHWLPINWNLTKMSMIDKQCIACQMQNYNWLCSTQIICLVVSVRLSYWVCENYVVHYLNGAGLRWSPPTCTVHHWPALCTMVHKGGLCLWEVGVTPDIFPGKLTANIHR